MNVGIGKGKKTTSLGRVRNPGRNQGKKWIQLVAVIGVTVGCILYVSMLGKQAEQTIPVVMFGKNIAKNQQIKDDGEMLVKYDMLLAEYKKYGFVNENESEKRKIILWDERSKLVNTFAAFPLQKDTVAMYRDFIKSRVDNSDAVLYSFPGKVLVPLEVSGGQLDAIKTFIQPGDKLNIKASYKDKIQKSVDDGYGNKVNTELEVQKTDEVFTEIEIADLLNQKGESVLDMYQKYNTLTVWQQASLDNDSAYQTSIIPKTLLVALTPEESDRYNYYLSKQEVNFRVELPQRIN